MLSQIHQPSQNGVPGIIALQNVPLGCGMKAFD